MAAYEQPIDHVRVDPECDGRVGMLELSVHDFDLSSFFQGANALKTRLANAWHGRAVARAGGNPVLVLVGGYAGFGKCIAASRSHR